MNDVSVADEAEHLTQVPLLRRSFFPALRRWLREPLIHFLLIGAFLFAVDRYLQRSARRHADRRSRFSYPSTISAKW